MSFRDFLQEDVKKLKVTDDFIKYSENLQLLIKKHNLFKEQIMWRGFNIKGLFGPAFYVDNSKKTKHIGNVFSDLEKSTASEISTKLKIKNPVFLTTDYDSAKFFGAPFIVIPDAPYKIFTSPIVSDMLSVGRSSLKDLGIGSSEVALDKLPHDEFDIAIKMLLKTYVPKAKISGRNEGILDTVGYYMGSVHGISTMTNKDKFNKIKTNSDYKTYSNLYSALSSYIRQMKYQNSKQKF